MSAATPKPTEPVFVMPASARDRTAALKAAMRRQFSTRQYAIMFEVRDATGFNASRSADAVAMCMWPSRGLVVEGFEFKVTRSDWQREINNPAKAEAVWKYCDYWSLVTTPNVAKPDEIPPGWGWLELHDDGILYSRARAAKTEAAPLDRTFIASMLRSAAKADEAEVAAAVEAEVARRRAGDEERIQSEATRLAGVSTQALELWKRVKEITGDPHWWNNEDVVAAVRAVYQTKIVNRYNGLGDIRRTLAEALARVDEAMAALGVEAPPAKPKRRARP